MYKAFTGNWPIVIRGLLKGILKNVYKSDELGACILWRVIGDEMVFVLPIQAKNEILPAIDAIFEVTQRISFSLKSGKFYDTLENQSLRMEELNVLKTQNTLSIKSAAWIAVVNEEFKSPYDNVRFDYSASSNNQTLREYLGKDIDAGFRLKEYTQDRRLAISFELAYLIQKISGNNNLHILDYVRLKGVWNESLYPIIWYYNADIAKEYSLVNCGTESRIFNYSFDHSFRYDETENNPIVKKYFSTRRILSHKKNKGKKVSDTSDLELAVGMYKITSALDKIVNDRNLSPKFQYIESLLENNNARTTRNKPYAQPLELHCAVVCCNVEDRTVLIMRRSSEHATCPEKWEFGCAKATNDEPLISSIISLK